MMACVLQAAELLQTGGPSQTSGTPWLIQHMFSAVAPGNADKSCRSFTRVPYQASFGGGRGGGVGGREGT